MNIPFITVPTTLPTVSTSVSQLEVVTPINPPHLPPSDNTRYFGPQSPLTEHLDADFHDFRGNGNFSGLSSNMSSASAASQPGSVPALDPFLKCQGCEKQFREGEIQLYKQHTSSCDKLRLLRHPSPSDDETVYREQINTAEQELDPNLTCIGCGRVFRERQIQDFRRHCRLCSMFQESLRSRAQSSPGSKCGAEDHETEPRSRSNTGT